MAAKEILTGSKMTKGYYFCIEPWENIVIKKILLVLILINMAYVWSGATRFGAQSIDVYADWLFKAKILYLNNGRIPTWVYQVSEYKSAHWQYPFLWPIMVYEIYKIWGFNEQNIYKIFPVIYALILVLAYINLRKAKISKIKSLMMVYVYSMTGPLLAQGGRYHAGNADILICLLGWLIISFRQKKWLVALLVMAASMIKTEGVFWAVFLFNSTWLWLAIIPTALWQLIIHYFRIPTDFGLTWQINIFSQIWGLVRGVLREIFQFNQWYLIWPIFLLSAKKNPLWKPFLLMLGGFGLVYIFTNLGSYGYVTSSLDRVLLQLSPIWMMIFSVA